MQLFKQFQTLQDNIVYRQNKLFNSFAAELSNSVTYGGVIADSPKGWWNGNNIVLNSGNVSQMTDLSGNGYHLVQATASYQPLWVDTTLNNYPIVRFDGNDNRLEVSFGLTYSGPNTIFLVWSSELTTYNVVLGCTVTDTSSINFYEAKVRMSVGTVVSYSKTAPFTSIITTALFSGSNSLLYENGVLQNSGNVASSTFQGIILGSYAGAPGSFYKGDIAEVIFYNRALTTIEKEKTENYLKLKYALV